MAKQIAINATMAKKIISDLEQFENLKTHILRLIPENVIPYGSKLWWEKAELEADEDIKAERYTTYNNAKELIKDLHAGK